MAKKKAINKPNFKEDFAKACVAMYKSDGKSSRDAEHITDFDQAAGDAMEAVLKEYGRPIEKDMLTVILKLGLETAEYTYKHAYLIGHIDSMVETGYLERRPDGLMRATQKLIDRKPVTAA